MRHPILTSLVLVSLLTGCASIREARMAQAPSVEGVAQESFGKPGWGRQGEFMLSGQRVRYERGADRLALFSSLTAARAPLRYTWSGPGGDSSADCAAKQAELTSRGSSVTVKPWTLTCQWTGGGGAATMQIGEGQVRQGKATREGSYRRGELTLGVRSVHLFEGSSLAQTDAVGYEMLHEGQVVGSLDVSGSVPRLRRPDPATPLGRAVTEAALALALVWEPN